MKAATKSFYRYLPVSDRDRNWGLYATTAGESLIAPGTVYPPAGHPKSFAFDWSRGRILDSFALVYISGGGGKFESRPSGPVQVESGFAFLLFPGVWHRYAPDLHTGWHEHWIGFEGDTARQWLKHRFISARQPVLKVHPEDAVRATFSQVLQSVRQNRPALQQILAGATASLLGMCYSARQTPAAASPNPSAIELAIARIHTDFARELDMAALARELGVSYSSFRSSFTTHTGLSPHQYLLELRLMRARQLLADTTLTVKGIALETGFRDEHYFSRLFRQKMNRTPSQWRQRHRRAL
jgi:AraC-like DNA-binding protein